MIRILNFPQREPEWNQDGHRAFVVAVPVRRSEQPRCRARLGPLQVPRTAASPPQHAQPASLVELGMALRTHFGPAQRGGGWPPLQAWPKRIFRTTHQAFSCDARAQRRRAPRPHRRQPQRQRRAPVEMHRLKFLQSLKQVQRSGYCSMLGCPWGVLLEWW